MSKIAVLQENLKAALDLVSQAVDSKPVLPVLGHIAVRVHGNYLELLASDLELGISRKIGARIDDALRSKEDYGMTVPAKLFKDLVHNLSPERVDIDFDFTKMITELSCGDVKKTKLKGMSLQEFPPIRQEGELVTCLERVDFVRALQNVIEFAATEDKRPIIKSVLMSRNGGGIDFVAVDGYRLALDRIEGADWRHELDAMAIPLNVAIKLIKILKDFPDDELKFSRDKDRFLLIQTHSLTLQVTLLDGKYPDYLSVLPKTFEHQAIMYTEDLARAIKRVSLFGKKNANQIFVSSAPEKGQIAFLGKNSEQGSLLNVSAAYGAGAEIYTAINSTFITDILKTVKTEQIVFEANTLDKPVLFRAQETEYPKYLLMPFTDGTTIEKIQKAFEDAQTTA